MFEVLKLNFFLLMNLAALHVLRRVHKPKKIIFNDFPKKKLILLFLPRNVLASRLYDVLAFDLRDGHRLHLAVLGGLREAHRHLKSSNFALSIFFFSSGKKHNSKVFIRFVWGTRLKINIFV